jgi:hypothetical protein
VPDTNATVTLAALKRSANAFERQARDVADIHDDVKHTPRSPPPPRSSPAVAVCSPMPKLSPDTVTDAYPLCGTFSRASDVTAESKVSRSGIPVPDTDETVRVELLKMSPTAFARHASVVADVHDDVTHAPRSPPPPRSSPAVIVLSLTPNERPETVTDACPLCGEFCRRWEITEASKVMPLKPIAVPLIKPTVTPARRSP